MNCISVQPANTSRWVCQEGGCRAFNHTLQRETFNSLEECQSSKHCARAALQLFSFPFVSALLFCAAAIALSVQFVNYSSSRGRKMMRVFRYNAKRSWQEYREPPDACNISHLNCVMSLLAFFVAFGIVWAYLSNLAFWDQGTLAEQAWILQNDTNKATNEGTSWQLTFLLTTIPFGRLDDDDDDGQGQIPYSANRGGLIAGVAIGAAVLVAAFFKDRESFKTDPVYVFFSTVFALAIGVPCAVGLANPDIGSKALGVVGVIMLLSPIPAYMQINVSVLSTTGNVGAYCWESVGEAVGKGNDYGEATLSEAFGTKKKYWILGFGLVMGLIFEALLVQFEMDAFQHTDVSERGQPMYPDWDSLIAPIVVISVLYLGGICSLMCNWCGCWDCLDWGNCNLDECHVDPRLVFLAAWLSVGWIASSSVAFAWDMDHAAWQRIMLILTFTIPAYLICIAGLQFSGSIYQKVVNYCPFFTAADKVARR
jgi:hypothetical protein